MHDKRWLPTDNYTSIRLSRYNGYTIYNLTDENDIKGQNNQVGGISSHFYPIRPSNYKPFFLFSSRF